MKKLIVTFAIAALALPLSFAQTSRTKSGTKTQQSATVSSKVVRHAVALASVPEPARDAITQAIGAGKITRLVSVTTGGTVSGYEAVVTTGKKRSTMKFDANGNHA